MTVLALIVQFFFLPAHFVSQVAAHALESSLLKYGAKEHFFRAALCHLCVDALNAQHALAKYEEQYPAFADSREAKLIKVGGWASMSSGLFDGL